MEFSEVRYFLETLCKPVGTSGLETDAGKVASALLSEFMEVKTDKFGNIIGTMGSGYSVMLDAHLDQIGLIVTSVDEDGFVHISKVGGSDVRVLTAAEVVIHSSEDIFGVIVSTPPHLSDNKNSDKVASFDEILIDIGMKKSEADMIIKPGDRISFKGNFTSLLNCNVTSPSIDDRAGIAAVLRAMQLLKDKNTCKINVCFSVQEETGGTGAMISSFNLQPDEAIAVDVSFASAPSVSSEKYPAAGSGVLIGFGSVLDYDISRKMVEIAEKNNIPFNREVMGGRTGTNGDEIQVSGKGIKTSVLSIPIRNMHTAVEVCNLADIENTARLISEYIIERSASVE